MSSSLFCQDDLQLIFPGVQHSFNGCGLWTENSQPEKPGLLSKTARLSELKPGGYYFDDQIPRMIIMMIIDQGKSKKMYFKIGTLKTFSDITIGVFWKTSIKINLLKSQNVNNEFRWPFWKPKCQRCHWAGRIHTWWYVARAEGKCTQPTIQLGTDHKLWVWWLMWMWFFSSPKQLQWYFWPPPKHNQVWWQFSGLIPRADATWGFPWSLWIFPQHQHLCHCWFIRFFIIMIDHQYAYVQLCDPPLLIWHSCLKVSPSSLRSPPEKTCVDLVIICL